MPIEFKELSYFYQPNSPFSSQALFGINLSMTEKSYTAVIGHTGSGKSTLIQHLNGLLIPTEGKVVVNDVQITPESKQKEIKSIRKRVGVVFQFPEAQLFEETVIKDVAFGPQNFGVAKEEAERIAKEKLELVGIQSDYFERSPFELSGGQMRRVAIAGILAMEPEVLVLDEPTAGLDPKSRNEMMALFYDLYRLQGLTVILVTHNMDDVANYADFVFILEKGKLLKSGKPIDIFQEVDFVYAHGLGLPKATEFAVKLKAKGFQFDQLPINRKSLVEKIVAGQKGQEVQHG